MFYEDQLQKKVYDWKNTAQKLTQYTQKSNDLHHLTKMAECIAGCGDILDAYSGLIKFAAERYEENEKSFLMALEE